MFKLFPLALAALAPAVNQPAAVQTTDEVVSREAREIFETVLSPYCPGRTISNCPSPQADELRASIRTKLEAGESTENVKEELYSIFGDELRTIPRASGFGLFAWIVPAVGFLLGGWAIAVWVRRTRMPQMEPSGPASTKLDPEAEARLKAELADLESSI